jgi:hypothetical protein
MAIAMVGPAPGSAAVDAAVSIEGDRSGATAAFHRCRSEVGADRGVGAEQFVAEQCIGEPCEVPDGRVAAAGGGVTVLAARLELEPAESAAIGAASIIGALAIAPAAVRGLRGRRIAGPRTP